MKQNLEEIVRKKVLLVCPDFPIPKKRKIQHDFLPIGLLKIGTFLRDRNNCEIRLNFGNESIDFCPDFVLITSLFTYWSNYVHDSVDYYKEMYPNAIVIVGGIYATLMPDLLSQTTNAMVYKGLCKPADEWCREHGVDYSILHEPVDFQIIHGMRGCFRKCGFCGTWILEPQEEYVDNIARLVQKNHVVFYDNNFLRHPDIRHILRELRNVRVNDKVVIYESQSGFDGRILNQELATLLKKARFINPRIAWDNSYEDWPKIQSQIEMLHIAGYKNNEINIFMIYNWNYDFEEMERKRIKCWSWGVQIMDCRYRPLNQPFDYFNSRLKQSNSDYHINSNWSDEKIKQFRKNVRRQNICVRHSFPFHSSILEHMKVAKEQYGRIVQEPKADILKEIPDAWFPGDFTPAKTEY